MSFAPRAGAPHARLPLLPRRSRTASSRWQTGDTFERFSDRARAVLVLAQEEASRLDHPFIGTEHILLGLLAERESAAAEVLGAVGVSLDVARQRVKEAIGPIETASTGSPPFTPRAKKVLELSLREALRLGHHDIGPEHMLLGLLQEGEGVAVQVLTGLGVDLRQVRENVVVQATQGHDPGRPSAEVRRFPLGVVGAGDESPGRYATLRVVTAGRGPGDYEAAYADLSDLLERLGLDAGLVLPSQLEVSTTHTTVGPGIVVSVTVTLPEGEHPA